MSNTKKMPLAFKQAVRKSLVPLRYFEYLRETVGGWLCISHDPYAGRGPLEMILTYDGDLKPKPTGETT